MNPTAIPESALRFTSHEILALLTFNPGENADFSRKVLVLAQLPEDHDLVRAGITTLNVRDQLELSGEDMNLRGGALVLSVILSTATEWHEVTRFGKTSSLPAFVVSSPHGKAALFMRPLSEYLCLPLTEGADLKALLEQNVNSSVAEAQGMDGGLVTVRRHVFGEEISVANVKVNADGTRQLAALPLQSDGQLTVSAIPAGESAGGLVRDKLFPTA